MLKVPAVTRWKPQQFMAVHASDKGQQFRKGLRSYASYRDLGISKATSPVVTPHIGTASPSHPGGRHSIGQKICFSNTPRNPASRIRWATGSVTKSDFVSGMQKQASCGSRCSWKANR